MDPLIQTLSWSITSEGDLNYAITRLCLAEVPETYADYNALIGVLECAKQEFYRRAVATYEDEKLIENGDVYDQTSDRVVEAEGD